MFLSIFVIIIVFRPTSGIRRLRVKQYKLILSNKPYAEQACCFAELKGTVIIFLVHKLKDYHFELPKLRLIS